MLCFILWVFFLLFIFVAVRYAVFFLSNQLAGELGDIREQIGPLVFPILRAVASAMLADVVLFLTLPFLLLPEGKPDGPGIPVVMVHGLYHNRTAWLIMKRWLARAGFTNLHTYQYNSFTRDFEPAVLGLLRKLDRLDGKVVLVGHSLGGLVSRCVAGNPQYRDRIAGLVSLGSPHGGSDLARLAGNRMGRGLIPGHHIPQSVERMSDPNCPRLGVYSLTDDYVCPVSMLRTGREGWVEKVCSPMSHVWMLYSCEIANMVSEFLKKEIKA